VGFLAHPTAKQSFCQTGILSLLLLTSDFYPIAKPSNFFSDCFFLTFKFFLDWKYCFDLGLVSSTFSRASLLFALFLWKKSQQLDL